MAASYTLITADGDTSIYTIPFTYINRNDVQVYLNNIQQLNPGHYVFINDSQIKFFGTVNAGTIIRIQRSTSPNSADVTFQNGAVLTASDLNTATLQNFYRTQEIQDQIDSYIGGGLAAVAQGTSSPDPAVMIAAAAQSVLNSSLLADLQSQISDIDSNANAIIANTSSIVTLQATVDALATVDGTGIATFLSNEQTQRIAGDTALAETISLIGAANGGNTAFVLNMATTQVNGTTSLGDYLSALTSTVTTNNTTLSAAITSEATTRASADSASASTVSALSSTVAGHTASIATQASSISGLDAQYTVKVDVNGHVAGFGLASTAINGTPTSSFIVSANNFAVVDPGNGVTTPVVPFSISGGIVYMNDVVIEDALIGSLTLTKLNSGSLNADMNIGTGKIIWDNGAYMKVTGVGFGSSNQFLTWFGPHFASFSSCTEANAISYEKVDGSAYFGGTLLSGVLSNSTQATVLDTTNVADLGPFSSNGGTITINWSYVFAAANFYAGTSGGLTSYNGTTKENPAAQLILSRSINGGSFSDVLTINITNGSWDGTAPQPADVAPGDYRQFMSGSGTYTDPSTVAQPREYKLRINSRTNVNTTVATNTLSLHSTE